MANESESAAELGVSNSPDGETRRQFVKKLAKAAALPVIVPLSFSMSTAALA